MIEEITVEYLTLRQQHAENIAKSTDAIAKINLILAALHHSPYPPPQDDCPT